MNTIVAFCHALASECLAVDHKGSSRQNSLFLVQVAHSLHFVLRDSLLLLLCREGRGVDRGWRQVHHWHLDFGHALNAGLEAFQSRLEHFLVFGRFVFPEFVPGTPAEHQKVQLVVVRVVRFQGVDRFRDFGCVGSPDELDLDVSDLLGPVVVFACRSVVRTRICDSQLTAKGKVCIAGEGVSDKINGAVLEVFLEALRVALLESAVARRRLVLPSPYVHRVLCRTGRDGGDAKLAVFFSPRSLVASVQSHPLALVHVGAAGRR
mmetsp:Transcript_12441/g.29157  ORF Transcript_12441/g.29157 Transcript_12441/m.29157 type:complete len:264 (+) Transcript_12441:848-1639(+)